MKRWVIAVMSLLVACSTPSAGPPSGSPAQTRTSEGTPAVSLTPGWNVSDGKVTTRDDLAYWIVSYDAAWTGEGDPPEEKCVFKVRNQEGVVVRQTGEVLEEGNDVEAETIYPDEVPGRPQTVSIDCKSG
jgi:hypothetical protein